MIRSKGEAGTGNVVEAVRHMREITSGIKRARATRAGGARRRPPRSTARRSRSSARSPPRGALPVPLFCAGGIATPADAALMMQLGAEGNFVGSGHLQELRPGAPGPRDRRGDHPLRRPRAGRRRLGRARRGDAGPGDLRAGRRRRAAAGPRCLTRLAAASCGSASSRSREVSRPIADAARARRRAARGARAGRPRRTSTASSSPAARARRSRWASRRPASSRRSAPTTQPGARSSAPAPG